MSGLIGYGSHGRDIEAIWNRVHGSVLAIGDDDPTKHLPLDRSILTEPCFVGVNDPLIRRRIVERDHLCGAPALVDPSATIGHDTHLGHGVVIGPHALLLVGVTVGDHTHINYGVSMTRCAIGAFVTVCPGVVICGDVQIGEECLIGAGAVICDRVTIGNRVRIGAGAVIPPRSVVPDDSRVLGVWKAAA